MKVGDKNWSNLNFSTFRCHFYGIDEHKSTAKYQPKLPIEKKIDPNFSLSSDELKK
jgi:hypothetical protein